MKPPLRICWVLGRAFKKKKSHLGLFLEQICQGVCVRGDLRGLWSLHQDACFLFQPPLWTAGVTLASSFPSRPLGALCNVLLTYGGSFAVFLEGLSYQFEQVIHVGWGIRLKIGLRPLLTGP